jgi:hypothetical protein
VVDKRGSFKQMGTGDRAAEILILFLFLALILKEFQSEKENENEISMSQVKYYFQIGRKFSSERKGVCLSITAQTR